MRKLLQLFSADQPLETTIGLAIVLFPLYLFTPPMVSALVTESTRAFTLVMLLGWVLLISTSYFISKKVRIPDQDEGYGALVIWILSVVAFTPASAALSYMCFQAEQGTVIPIILTIEAGLLWGTWMSWREYSDI